MPLSSSRDSSPSVSREEEAATASSDERTSNRLWPRATTALLLLVGLAMAAVGFATVVSMPDMAWHPARDAELQATYDAYRDTGTLLIKETGSGSYGVQAPADGPLTFATWDDDPGSYIIASLMSHVTGSPSPYPGLKLAQALLVAIPLLWLPLAVARVVGRSRAGYALILLPLVIWLFNHGATLVGTEYGLSDRVSTLPVYSLYGTAASLAFLSLALVVLLSTYRLGLAALIGATVGISVLAALGNMSRSLSGMGVAVAVGVLWWIYARGRWRWVAAIGGSLAAIVLASVIQTGLMTAINVDRSKTTGQAMTEVPDAHTAWHSLYLGLSYPEPLNGQPSRFDVTWSDEFGWAKAREVDPDVLVASEEYDTILQGLYLDQVFADPVGATKLYVHKTIYLAKHFGGLLLFIVVGFAVGLSIRSTLRARLGRVLAMVAPLLALGIVPAVMVMPMLYYYSELAAALGLLAAVSLGVIVWALTSWPARARASEMLRTAGDPQVNRERRDISVVLDEQSLRTGDLEEITRSLTHADELIIVTSQGEPDTDQPARDVGVEVRRVISEPEDGIGHRLRSGVLETGGDRLLVVGGTLGDTAVDFIERLRLNDESVLPAANAGSQRAVDVFRETLLGSKRLNRGRVIILDGAEGRAIVKASKESGELWFDEVAFATVTGGGRSKALAADVMTEPRESRGSAIRESIRALTGFSRIALRREEYVAAGRSRFRG